MRKLFLAAMAAFAGLGATPATACRIWTPSASLSVIHRELPSPLPPGAMAFEVQFEPADRGWQVLFRGTRVRVRRVIRGDYSGDTLIVRDSLGPTEVRITCYEPIRYDGAGLVVGMPMGFEDGVLVLKPIFDAPNLPRQNPATN